MKNRMIRHWGTASIVSTVCLLAFTNGCSTNVADEEEEEVGSIEQPANTAAGVQLAYRVAFGRYPTQTEINYWVGTGWSQEQMLAYFRGYMRTSAGATERQQVIGRAYQTVYLRGPGTNEFNYWNSYLSSNDAHFSDVCKWNENYGRSNGFAVRGSFTIKHWVDSVTFPGVEDYTGKTYSVPAN